MRSANVVGKFGAFGISALTLCGASANTETLSEDEMQVLKKGNTVYIRNAFSADQDLVRSVALGVHNKQINFLQTFLIPKSAPITAKTKLIHGCGDDACPWNLNGTYIGGNHGCSDGRLATVLNHGLATSDIGSEWEDEAGTKFYILKIVDQNHFVVLSENKGKNEIWRFTKNHRGDFTERKSGRKLKIKKWEMAQLWPSCRIKKQKYLVNGKTPLKEDETVNCGFLDIIEEYDVIRPDSLLESAKDNPGKELNFTAADLDYVTNNKITYRFQPRGACEIRYQAEAGCDFRLGYMGFIQTSPLCQGKYGTHEYYIPKTLPFKAKDRKLDFKNIIDFSGKWDTVNFHVDRGKYLEYPKNLPERFVQFLGDIEKGKKRRKVGYAYGYSLIEGDTKTEIRAKNCSNALFLYRSRKSYPHAIDGKMCVIPKGKKFLCVAYRQYFNPSAYSANATDVYCHRQGDAIILYADYHKSVDRDIIKLPETMIGKSVSVIEKTPSIRLLSGDKVPEKGVALSIKDNYGYIVLKVR